MAQTRAVYEAKDPALNRLKSARDDIQCFYNSLAEVPAFKDVSRYDFYERTDVSHNPRVSKAQKNAAFASKFQTFGDFPPSARPQGSLPGGGDNNDPFGDSAGSGADNLIAEFGPDRV
jgi:hypothetical protein